MNILIDTNPNTVNINGKSYRINTDFRISILFEMMINDRNLTEKEKMANAINLYYPIIPEGLDRMEILTKAMEQIVWFYKCGIEEVATEGSSQPVYCYEADAEYIYAAFLTQYNIDLQDDILHWWKFRALFKSLNDEHQFSKIIGYRTMTIDSNMSDREKDFYREMKRIYRIPDKRTIEEIEEDFINSIDGLF